MALIYNPRPDSVSVQVAGNWFEFKPGQVKLIHNDNFAHVIVTDKAYEGLVDVPDIMVEQPNSEEALKIKKAAQERGIRARVEYLEKVKYNLLVSLQKDLDIKGLKISPLTLASAGEKAALRELVKYQDMAADEQAKELAELTKITEKLSDGTNKSNTGKTAKGN